VKGGSNVDAIWGSGGMMTVPDAGMWLGFQKVGGSNGGV